MLRIRSRRLLVALAAALTLVGCSASGSSGPVVPPDLASRIAATGAPAPKPRPNIVFVLTDDLSSDLVRYMPHVQAMEHSGARFSNYFVVDSLCCPSRAAIFTGEYPHNDGVWTNGVGGGGYPGFQHNHDDQRSFGLALHEAGYRTGFMGKYMNGYGVHHDPPAIGWDEWDVAGGEAYDEFDYHMNENGKVRHYGTKPEDYFTTVMGVKAHQFIDKSVELGKPFMLEVSTYAPHLPATPAPADAGAFPTVRAPRGPSFNAAPEHATTWYARHPPLTATQIASIDTDYRRRVACVQAVDRMIGDLQKQLAEKGLLDNTYFVFSSDNGFHMGQYRLMPGKQTAYDTDIHVPLVVTGPGIAPATTIDQMASSIDLAPTFDEIAGAPALHEQDGASLLPLLHGERPSQWQRAILVEHYGAKLPRNDPDWQEGPAANPPGYEAMRTADALYVEYRDGEREYYDLRTDPLEMNNIVSALSAQRLAVLHKTLHALATCAGAQCRATAAEA